MPWDPLDDVRAWQARLERLAVPQAEAWAPALDVYETTDRYVVTAELPGFTREQVDLALEETRLTIRGHRAGGPHAAGAADGILHYHQVERGHGRFARRFDFAAGIDVAAVSAQLADGVLTVVLPKLAPPPARKIEVR